MGETFCDGSSEANSHMSDYDEESRRINRIAGDIIAHRLGNDNDFTPRTSAERCQKYLDADIGRIPPFFEDSDYFFEELNEDITRRVMKGINGDDLDYNALAAFDKEYGAKIWSADMFALQEYAFMLCDVSKLRFVKESMPNLAKTFYGRARLCNYSDFPISPKAKAFVKDYPSEALVIAKGAIRDMQNGFYEFNRKLHAEQLHSWHHGLYEKALHAVLTDIKNGDYSTTAIKYQKRVLQKEMDRHFVISKDKVSEILPSPLFEDFKLLNNSLIKEYNARNTLLGKLQQRFKTRED